MERNKDLAMKTLLTTLHSKYIHASLALQYLKSCCKHEFQNIEIREYTVNHDVDYILGEIYKGKYDLVCFSCYLWNISETLIIGKNLKKVNPQATIVLGGPEVSFDAVDLMEQHDFIDYIVIGEGEVTFQELLRYICKGQGELEDIRGIAYRKDGRVCQTQERELIQELDAIPSPFSEGLEGYENKIIYYESSRGCPHNCRYCLSSTIKGVRFFSLDRVKKDLDLFLKEKVKQVKFVDRTFNAKKSHSLEIMKYIQKRDNGHTNFHFEITADLLDEETLEFLSQVREGLFQFEVGVQTTYDVTMEAIDRRVNFDRLSKTVKKISEFRNIHLHLDLIAGLPYEDFQRFRISFDEVYALKPEKLQLGFLKLLKGSGIRRDEKFHDYIYKDEAPYEVLANRYISYDEMLQLKMMEEMIEIYYNSHGFDYAVAFILYNFYDRPSDFYLDLAHYWEESGYHHTSHGRNELYEILLKFYGHRSFEAKDIFQEILKFDYVRQGKGVLPDFFHHGENGDFKNRMHRFLQDQGNIAQYLPQYEGLPAKQILKKVHFESFAYDILKIIQNPHCLSIEREPMTLLFDYDLKHKVFAKSKFYKVNL